MEKVGEKGDNDEVKGVIGSILAPYTQILFVTSLFVGFWFWGQAKFC